VRKPLDGSGTKRLLLIEPPFYRLYYENYSLTRLPLSLAYLAGMVRRETDWQVQIYNADFSRNPAAKKYSHLAGRGFLNYMENLKNPAGPVWSEVQKAIEDFKPSVVGVTVKSQNFASACMVANIAKKIDGNIFVIMGGPHPSMVRTDILEDRAIDIGVFGEGEQTLVDVLCSVEGGSGLEEIAGIVYRRGLEARETNPRPLLSDEALDDLPFPVTVARDTLKDYEHYPPGAFSAVFASRGCPNNCTFCGSRYIWTRRTRFRSVHNVISEMREIARVGVTHVHFDDDTFGVRKSYTGELCRAIETELPGIRWSCEIHVNLVDEQTIAAMRKAGCWSVQVGVESGNNEMLRVVRKGFTIERARAAATLIRKHGIRLEAFFMVGFPQETVDSLDDTIREIKTFPCDSVSYSIFTPYPGTELFDYCRERGIVSDDFDVSLFNHQSPLNHFCPDIPQQVFQERLRRLERDIDKLNAWREVRRNLSREGLARLRGAGVKAGISKLSRFARNVLTRRS